MPSSARRAAWLFTTCVTLSTAACSSSAAHGGADGGGGGAPLPDGGDGGPSGGAACKTPPCAQSNIAHVVLIVQENHSFDSYFAHYCTAPTGSNPTCTSGPSCCEAGPAKDPGSPATPGTLDDAAHAAVNPLHTAACQTVEVAGGAMSQYVTAPLCGIPANFAYADAATAKPLWDLASAGALADRYFQPVIGASASNNMYFAQAKFAFTDNEDVPKGAVGATCNETLAQPLEISTPSIGDLFTAKGVPWAVYAEGYATMAAAVKAGTCPKPPKDCPLPRGAYPCTFDPDDIPFLFFPASRDSLTVMQDLSSLTSSLAAGALPAFSYVKLIGYKTEHPGDGVTISAGMTAVANVIAAIDASPLASSTLVLLTYDESGGYFDHIAPPAASAVDGKPYGPRVPLIAHGVFAKAGTISHVTMEHSSIVKFLEWNFLGGVTGQLGGRDAVVANIGSLLDGTKTGAAVPE